MRIVASLMSLALLTACAAGPAPRAQPRVLAEEPVAVAVLRDGDRWTADFTLNADAAVWAFQRSSLLRETRRPWRPDWWRVMTPGVVLERHGNYDILRSTDGGPVPRRIRMDMRPQAGDLEADYDPALTFSNGAVALYSEQFNLIPLPSLEAAAALPADLNGVETPGGPSTVSWRDTAGSVLFKGERRPAASGRESETYVLFGEVPVRQGRGVVTVMDPGLPAWLAQALTDFTPRVMDYYTSRLGVAEAEPPMVMAGWTGPSSGVTSMGGSVLPGLITMAFEGEGVMRPTAPVLTRSQWFIAHEGAHFWWGQNGLAYEFSRDAWITEGGADLLAIRAIKAVEPSFDERAELQREVEDCVRLSKGKTVASAETRGEHRAYYACGAVWSLAMEAAARRTGREDWLDVVRRLRQANLQDGILSRREWLDELTRVSGGPEAAMIVAGMLDRETKDPAAEIARLFDLTGVSYRLQAGEVLLN